MSFLQRTGRRFAASAVMVACFAASSAFAAMLATNDFETSYSGFTPDSGDITELVELSTYNGDSPSGAAAYPFADFGSKYLAVDSDTNTLWRSFDARSANTYFDSYVQFTPMYGDFEYPTDAKFVIFLDSATSNLCVVSGTSANDPTPVTNTLTTATVEPNSWGRLTVSAVSGDVFSFQIRVNGTLFTAGGTNTFYSMAAGTTLSEVGFSGTGALDNFAVRTTDPFFSGTVAATIGGENGEKYASLEDALAEADADTVVTLAADHAGKVYLADAATFKIDNSGGYAFGGVVGANGYKVTAGEPVAGVTTYTATDAFASQPSPVVVWDGSSENYDFNTLTRTVGANTYTLNLNEQNTVGGSGAYVQIGPNNAQKAITLTAASTGAFGTSGQVTVIMKCSELNLTDNTYRGLIGLLSDEGGYYSGDNNVKIGIATGWNESNGAGVYTPYIANGVQNSYSQNTTAYTTGEQTICMVYNSASGTYVYRNGSLNASSTGIKYGTWMSPVGLVFGGMDLDGSTRVNAQTGMKISAVAVFTSALTAEQIAAFTFPSSRIAEDIAVSEINAIFGSAGEIWLNVADGVTITGDTTFNATTVHFVSAGEVVLYPPAGNAATLDFSGVTKPVVAYNGVLPTQSGSTFTSTTVPTWVTGAEQWTGTVWLRNKTDVTAFESNPYGNASSVLRLTGIKGWLKTYTENGAYTNAVPIELSNDGAEYGLWVNNGSSANSIYEQRYTVFNKLQGSGTFKGSESAGNRAVFVVRDWSEFTGNINLTTKVVVFGEKMPEWSETKDGQIYVMSGTMLDVPSSATWTATEMTVAGTLSYASLAQLAAGTPVVLRDEGKINVPGTASAADFAKDFAKVSGTGTLLLTPSSSSSWIGLPTNNLSTALGVEISQGSLVVPPDAANTSHATNVFEIGSLSGSGTIQGNYGDYYAYRKLRIIQSTNTVWSGTVNADSYNRLYEFAVAPGASAGTLTISGNNSNKDTILTVESGAKVDLTGTWKGTVTVAGTLGVTGTVSGDLTLSDGATLKVNDRSNTLSVNNLTVSGTVSVYLPATAAAGDTFLSTSAMPTFSDAAFNIYVGETLDASLRVIATSNGLKIAPKAKGAKFFFH